MHFLLIGSPDQPAVVSRDQSQLPTSYTLIWRQAVHIHVLKKRQAAMSILEAGSPCPCFEKRQSLSILEAGNHVHGLWFRQFMSMFWKKAVFIYTGGRQPCPWPLISAVHVHVLKKGSLYLHWRQAAMSILELGSPCPCFDKKAVLIYTGGRQPCPFWKQAVHVHILKKRQSLSILQAGSHVHSGGRQSMSSGCRQSMSIFWRKGSLYLYWRQAAMSILEAGSPCSCF